MINKSEALLNVKLSVPSWKKATTVCSSWTTQINNTYKDQESSNDISEARYDIIDVLETKVKPKKERRLYDDRRESPKRKVYAAPERAPRAKELHQREKLSVWANNKPSLPRPLLLPCHAYVYYMSLYTIKPRGRIANYNALCVWSCSRTVYTLNRTRCIRGLSLLHVKIFNDDIIYRSLCRRSFFSQRRARAAFFKLKNATCITILYFLVLLIVHFVFNFSLSIYIRVDAKGLTFSLLYDHSLIPI